jgi:hypothetical protein
MTDSDEQIPNTNKQIILYVRHVYMFVWGVMETPKWQINEMTKCQIEMTDSNEQIPNTK